MRIRAALLSAGLMLIAGCDKPLPVEPSDVSVVTELAASSFRAGDSLVVKITVTNLGSTPVTIRTDECPQRLKIEDLSGGLRGPGSMTCPGNTRFTAIVAPGKSLVNETYWKGEVEGYRPPGTAMTYNAPGTYTVTGYAEVVWSDGDGDRAYWIYSAPVPVQLLAGQ